MKIGEITKRSRGLLITAIILVGGVSVFAFLQLSTNIPIKETWNIQASHLWLNWLKPCRYSRFGTDEPVPETAAWIRSQLPVSGGCDEILETKSSTLTAVLKRNFPNPTYAATHNFLMNWSTPELGKKYAMSTDDPFVILIRKCPNSSKVANVLHIKVTATKLGNGSIVEIWDNKVYLQL